MVQEEADEKIKQLRDHIMYGPRYGPKLEKAAQKREKQERATEKPKLDNARRLRGIHFIDPEDGEYKETIKNAQRKLEVPMEAAMLCKKGTKSKKELIEPQETERRGYKSDTIPKQSMHVS